MTGRFTVDTVEAEDHWLVSVGGTLDAGTVGRLGACLHELAGCGPNRLVVDTAKVRIVEFSGVEALIGIVRHLRQQGTRVALRPDDGGAYKALRRMGCDPESRGTM